MGVYIKGMEMPKGYLDIRIYADGRVVSESFYKYGEEIGTAVPIPPHGRPAVRGAWNRENNPSYSPFDGSSEYIYRCNQCGENNDRDSAFCPNCGADMREE